MGETDQLLSARCRGCGVPIGDSGLCGHPYLHASAECWEFFGMLQALEMERYGYPNARRVVVDAYAAQHPGPGTDRRDRQSVFIHLAALCLVVECERSTAEANGLLRRLTIRNDDFPVLERLDAGRLDLRHVWDATELDDYTTRALEWGRAVWDSYQPSQPIIRARIEVVESSFSTSTG